jgi:hypothetical protein
MRSNHGSEVAWGRYLFPLFVSHVLRASIVGAIGVLLALDASSEGLGRFALCEDAD